MFRNRLVIIGYHVIAQSPFGFPDWCILDLNSFRNQLLYLKSHFEMLPLSEAVDKCVQKKLRRPTAVITFDDGYQSNFDTAFPVLVELNIPATIFLTTGFIDTDDTLWSCRINTALEQYTQQEFFWNGKRFELGTAEAKARTSKSFQDLLKKLPHRELVEEVRRIVEALGDDPLRPVERHSLFRMLDTRSIEEMLQSGLISVGAHTHSHVILSLLAENEQKAQISRSLDVVRDLTGEACRVFAYPNGRREDFSNVTTEILKKCGVNLAVTTIDGHNRPTTPLLELRRVVIGGTWKMGYFPISVHPHPGLMRW